MATGHTAYDFGGVDTDAGLADEETTHDRDVVVVDGTAMRYEDYRLDGSEET